MQLYELLFATVVKGQSNQYLWVVGRMKSWLLRLEQPKGRRYCRRVVAVGRQRHRAPACASIAIEKRETLPGARQALAACQKGDTFACWRLDRVGRSVQHLSKFIADLESRGVHFKTADGSADTSTSNGRLLLHILGAVAQFERDLIIERTRAGWHQPSSAAGVSVHR